MNEAGCAHACRFWLKIRMVCSFKSFIYFYLHVMMIPLRVSKKKLLVISSVVLNITFSCDINNTTSFRCSATYLPAVANLLQVCTAKIHNPTLFLEYKTQLSVGLRNKIIRNQNASRGINSISIYKATDIYPFSRALIGSHNSQFPRLLVDFEAEVTMTRNASAKNRKKVYIVLFLRK